MKRWLLVFILCAPLLSFAKPNNGAEALKALDSFLAGTMSLNAAINRVQFLGEEFRISSELVLASRRSNGRQFEQILEFLAALGVRNEEVERVFMNAMKSNENGEVMLGARGLGRIKSDKAVPALIELLSSPVMGPRREAARALGEIGKPAAAAALLKAAKAEKDFDLRLMMIIAAGKSGDKKQIPAFEALLTDDSESTRLAAGQALCAVGAPKCTQFANKLIASKDKNERFQGVMVFEGSPAKFSSATLKPLLADPDDKLRARACRILVQGGDKTGLEWLVLESTKAKGEVRLIYEDELEKLRITDEQRQAILKKAGLQ
jgi:HEAT repeat protein